VHEANLNKAHTQKEKSRFPPAESALLISEIKARRGINMSTILFFDDWCLQSRTNLVRELGQPTWIPEATLEDDLTEGTWNFPTAWYDAETNKWKALYCGAATYESKQKIKRSRNATYISKTQVLLYAESEDGIHWERPDLSEQVPINVRHCKNQVFESGYRLDGCPVYYDENDPDPKRRLKYLFSRGEGEDSFQGLATSGDGIHWEIGPVPWSNRLRLDGPICLFYNKHRATYIISNRVSTGNRRVAFMETKDFQTVSQPELILFPDPEDPPMVQYYGMPVFPYEDMYIGLLWRLHTDPEEIGEVKIFGPLDCALCYSYTGHSFNRAFHSTFIPRPELGEHGCGCIYVACMTRDRENLIRFYSGGSKAEHFRDQSLNDAALMLHTLRMDGFVSLKSYATKGRLITKGLVFEKPELSLNVRAPFGEIRVQVLDEGGEPVEGLTFADSIPFRGDELFHSPRWQSAAALKKVLGKQVYLNIEIVEGEIFAIRGKFEKTQRWSDIAQ
jgi:hypothetical protein